MYLQKHLPVIKLEKVNKHGQQNCCEQHENWGITVLEIFIWKGILSNIRLEI